MEKYLNITEISGFQFRFRKEGAGGQIVRLTEGVNVFYRKVTPECHFHPRKRLLSVIPVAFL